MSDRDGDLNIRKFDWKSCRGKISENINKTFVNCFGVWVLRFDSACRHESVVKQTKILSFVTSGHDR